MLQAIEEEKYYLGLFHKVSELKQCDPYCDELTVLAHELNILLPKIKCTGPSDPCHGECWDKVITGTKFLLAMHHEKRDKFY